MKILFDLFPVILFFLTYKFARHGGGGDASCLIGGAGANTPLLEEPILLATAVAIAATIVQVGWLLLRRKKVDAMLWVSLILIVVFGGATLYFRNPSFIQWKPTILYWSFGAILLFSAKILKKNLMRNVMEEQISLPERVWERVNLAFIGLFLVMGFANLGAAHMLSCDAWVNFKLYGLNGIMFLFIIGLTFSLANFVEKDSG